MKVQLPVSLEISNNAILKAHIITEAKASKARWSSARKANALTGEILEQAFNEWALENIPDKFKDNIEEETGDYHYDCTVNGQLIDLKYLISEKYFTISEHCYDHLLDVDYLVFYTPSGDGKSAEFLGVVPVTVDFLDAFSSSQYDGWYMRVRTLKEFLKKGEI